MIMRAWREIQRRIQTDKECLAKFVINYNGIFQHRNDDSVGAGDETNYSKPSPDNRNDWYDELSIKRKYYHSLALRYSEQDSGSMYTETFYKMVVVEFDL
jgi:hypothetical protein